jgi:hypothetical protein
VRDDPRDGAHRVLTATLGSIAPNTVVVDIDLERRTLLAHELVPSGDVARSALPLGPESS